MSDGLSKFIQRVEQLPDGEQNLLADYLQQHLDDVLDNARWEQSFGRSKTLFQKMRGEVDEAIRTDNVAPLDPDEL
jgi:hypothetical protein